MARTVKQNRDLGYNFEHSFVSTFNPTNDNPSEWQARRLGGASTGLPDIVITNNEENLIMTVECKATKGTTTQRVPQDEVVRCLTTLNVFARYKRRMVVLAFKYVKQTDKNRDKVKSTYYPTVLNFFRIRKITNINNLKNVYCTYSGKLTWTVLDPKIKTNIEYDHVYTFLDLKRLVTSHTDTVL